jgi:hypothetical protein
MSRHRIELDKLTTIELRAFVAVSIGVFFARLSELPLHVVGETLPGDVRTPTRRALRFFRTQVRFSWVDR